MSAALEVEIGPKHLSSVRHHAPGADAHRQPLARREDATLTHTELQHIEDPAQLQQRGVAASQDGAMPYFVGSWNGLRNNWYGDVGVSFVPQKDFTVVSLGRHHHNQTGLRQIVPVTLWSVETKQALAVVNVGPHSFLEGHYHWEPVDSPGVVLGKGKEYRLTQACTPNMADKWFDRTVSFMEVEANAATSYARFVGAVNQSGFGFPENTDGQFRRAGMVNFKMKAASGNQDSSARRFAHLQIAMVAVSLGAVLVAAIA